MAVKKADIKEILELYHAYRELQKNQYIINCIDDDLKTIQKLGPNLKIDIELPFSTIKETFDKTGVIPLRDVKASKKLLLGCGNRPCSNEPDDSEEHAHAGFITVNPELTMNPTVIAAFGHNTGLNQVLPENHYTELHGEAITLGTIVDDFDKSALKCMTKDFKTFEVGFPDPQDFDKSMFFYTTKETQDFGALLAKYDQFDESCGDQAITVLKKSPEILISYFDSLFTEQEREYNTLAFRSLIKDHPEDSTLQALLSKSPFFK